MDGSKPMRVRSSRAIRPLRHARQRGRASVRGRGRARGGGSWSSRRSPSGPQSPAHAPRTAPSGTRGTPSTSPCTGGACPSAAAYRGGTAARAPANDDEHAGDSGRPRLRARSRRAVLPSPAPIPSSCSCRLLRGRAGSSRALRAARWRRVRDDPVAAPRESVRRVPRRARGDARTGGCGREGPGRVHRRGVRTGSARSAGAGGRGSARARARLRRRFARGTLVGGPSLSSPLDGGRRRRRREGRGARAAVQQARDRHEGRVHRQDVRRADDPRQPGRQYVGAARQGLRPRARPARVPPRSRGVGRRRHARLCCVVAHAPAASHGAGARRARAHRATLAEVGWTTGERRRIQRLPAGPGWSRGRPPAREPRGERTLRLRECPSRACVVRPCVVQTRSGRSRSTSATTRSSRATTRTTPPSRSCGTTWVWVCSRTPGPVRGVGRGFWGGEKGRVGLSRSP